MQLPLCGNAYDDVTDFEMCGFRKDTKIKNETLFLFRIKKFINCASRATL